MSINSGILVPPSGGGIVINGNDVENITIGSGLNFANNTVRFGDTYRQDSFGRDFHGLNLSTQEWFVIGGSALSSNPTGFRFYANAGYGINAFYSNAGSAQYGFEAYTRDADNRLYLVGRSFVNIYQKVSNIYFNSNRDSGVSRIVSYNLQLHTYTSSNGQRTVTLGNAAIEPTAGIADGIVFWSAPAIDATNTAAPHFLTEDSKQIVLYPFVSFGTPTGTKTTTTFDTATVTVSELAERVYALIDALELTGLIETT